MFTLSSENRARYRFIDRTIESAEAFLDHPSAAEHLGVAAVIANQLMADRLYVPNVRHGELRLDKKRDDLIPVVALEPHETVIAPPEQSLPSSFQRDRIYETLRTIVPQGERLPRLLADVVVTDGFDRPLEITTPAGIKAAVGYNMIPLPFVSQDKTARKGLIRGRPIMALGYEKGYSRVSPSVIMHELKHVEQGETMPVVHSTSSGELYRMRFRNELAAYHTEKLAIDALVASGHQRSPGEVVDYEIGPDGRTYSSAAMIDQLRQEVNASRNDQFYPDDRLIKQLEIRGIDIVG